MCFLATSLFALVLPTLVSGASAKEFSSCHSAVLDSSPSEHIFSRFLKLICNMSNFLVDAFGTSK